VIVIELLDEFRDLEYTAIIINNKIVFTSVGPSLFDLYVYEAKSGQHKIIDVAGFKGNKRVLDYKISSQHVNEKDMAHNIADDLDSIIANNQYAFKTNKF